TGLAPTFLMPGQISSGLVPNLVPATPYAPPTNKELEILFQPMFDKYLEPPQAERPDSPAQAVQVSVTSADTPLSTTIDQDAPSPHISPSSSALQSHSLPPGVVAEPHFMEDNNVAPVDNNPFVNVFALEPHSEASSSGDISSTESPYVSQTLHHLNKWSKDHPLDNVIGNPSRPVSTRKQLAIDAFWCLYNSVLSKIEPKNFKSAIIEDCWFQAMQDEIHEFDRLQVEDLGKLQPTADIEYLLVMHKAGKYVTPSYFFNAWTDKFRARTKSGSCNSLCTPISKDLEILFQPIFDEYLEPPRAERSVSPASAVQAPVNSAGTPSSTPIDQDAPSPTITEDCWFQAMQDEMHEFDRLQIWEFVPQPNCVMIIALKWIYKVKLDEYGDVLKNKAWLVANGYRQEEGIDF
nr:retrovirus-related Pol polyprotein from transposon TNT 1-94 [Tanacetum cinerariifolium]